MRRIAQRAAGARRTRCSRRSRERGPARRRASSTRRAAAAQAGPWWDWSDVKRALEWLFWSGEVTSARRRDFERLYDLPERVLPRAVLAAPTPARGGRPARAGARSPRARSAWRAERDLRDYFRLPVAERRGRASPSWSRPASCCPVEVEGWDAPGLPAPRRARCRARVDARALLGPFDSLVWERGARRAAVRLPLPDRDLRPAAQARARLLRAAVPARRPARRARRPQGRPPGRARCSCRPRTPSPTRRRRRRRRCARSSSCWPAGSGSRQPCRDRPPGAAEQRDEDQRAAAEEGAVDRRRRRPRLRGRVRRPGGRRPARDDLEAVPARRLGARAGRRR